MTDLEPSSDPAMLVERGRALWEVARTRCADDRIDLFVKSAERRRVLRDRTSRAVSRLDSRETGLALRVARPRAAVASFASCAGISAGSIDWALRAARSSPPTVDGTMPGDETIESTKREDLDPGTPLPESAQLEDWLSSRGPKGWIESGITTEVLIGNGGWVAVRRRHRTWAMLDDDRPLLLACRGFEPPYDETGPPGDSPGLTGQVWLTPSAAAGVVLALADSVHSRIESVGWPVGPGWVLSDNPLHPSGLAGGSFDDAGFPAVSRRLADGSSCCGVISGPGTYRRRSYREPPIPGPTNLVVSSVGAPAPPDGSRVVPRCRVLRLSSDDWLLEMGGVRSEPPCYIRTDPRELLRICVGGWGPSRMSPDGVLTPGLVLSGLRPTG